MAKFVVCGESDQVQGALLRYGPNPLRGTNYIRKYVNFIVYIGICI